MKEKGGIGQGWRHSVHDKALAVRWHIKADGAPPNHLQNVIHISERAVRGHTPQDTFAKVTSQPEPLR